MKWFLVYWVLVTGASGEPRLQEVKRMELESIEQCRAQRQLSTWIQDGPNRGIGCLREDFAAAQMEEALPY